MSDTRDDEQTVDEQAQPEAQPEPQPAPDEEQALRELTKLISTFNVAAPRAYVAHEWYWRVTNLAGGDDIYSSAAAAYMAEDDSRYTDWTDQGNIATVIATDGELAEVLWKAGASWDKIAAAGWTDWGLVNPVDAAQVIFASGVVIESASTPAINGTFGITPVFMTRINLNLNYIQTGGKTGFPPNNASTKDWPTLDGGSVSFPSTGVFTDWAMAIIDYQAAVNEWALGAGGDPPPRVIAMTNEVQQ